MLQGTLWLFLLGGAVSLALSAFSKRAHLYIPDEVGIIAGLLGRLVAQC